MGVGELAEHLTHARHPRWNCHGAPGNGFGSSGKAPDGELLICDVICGPVRWVALSISVLSCERAEAYGMTEGALMANLCHQLD